MSKLKPCPQCGHIPLIGFAYGGYFVFSLDKIAGMCVCSSLCERYESKKLAEEAWNRRADNDRQ